jgi:hypothetical protein
MDGSPATKLRGLIGRIGYNTDTLIEFGVVTSVSPLRIRINGMKIDLEADDLVIAESLTDYTRKVTINGGSISGSVSPSGALTSLTVTDADMMVKGALQVGERVISAQINAGQTYVIIDRVGAM